MIASNDFLIQEPLVRLSDAENFSKHLDQFLSEKISSEDFSKIRTLYGIYGQKQPGVHMIRIKIPGGLLSSSLLRTLSEFNQNFCQGPLHITTRQDIQTYFIPLARTGEALTFLAQRGLTTREGCGNTIRNVTSCSLAGRCPKEYTDAGKVADLLAKVWIRSPLVQNLPRKVKFSVSGCETDCGGSSLHDLSFIATHYQDQFGFTVMAAGGLGGQPQASVKVLDFIEEDKIPHVVETLIRLHQRYSDRTNRNGSRVKFLLKRFGEEKFKALFLEEFDSVKNRPQRPQERLTWRTPSKDKTDIAYTPIGIQQQYNGQYALIVHPPLGNLTSNHLDEFALITDYYAIKDLRLTRDQTILIPDLAHNVALEIQSKLRDIGFDIPENSLKHRDIISCPGTTSCPIGITNSQNFAKDLVENKTMQTLLPGLSVRISGCQNGCGLHHVGDFGFHGMAKKINGQSAPHYQLHFGGDYHAGGQIGLAGPIIPAKYGSKALERLVEAFSPFRHSGHSVRDWVISIGQEGITKILAPLQDHSEDDLYVDWGENHRFDGAPSGKKPGQSLIYDELLANFSDDALINLDRYMTVSLTQDAIKSGLEAVKYSVMRILLSHQITFDKEASLEEILKDFIVLDYPLEQSLIKTIDSNAMAKSLSLFRENVALFIDLIRTKVLETQSLDRIEL